jgi:hypothetical protein
MFDSAMSFSDHYLSMPPHDEEAFWLISGTYFSPHKKICVERWESAALSFEIKA